MARIKTGIAINGDLWKRFKEDLKKKGLTTCFVLECLINAWLAGSREGKKHGVHPTNGIVINQKIEYQVARAHRRREGAKNAWMDGVNLTNHWNPFVGWTHKEADLKTAFGHAFGCQCSKCIIPG